MEWNCLWRVKCGLEHRVSMPWNEVTPWCACFPFAWLRCCVPYGVCTEAKETTDSVPCGLQAEAAETVEHLACSKTENTRVEKFR